LNTMLTLRINELFNENYKVNESAGNF